MFGLLLSTGSLPPPLFTRYLITLREIAPHQELTTALHSVKLRGSNRHWFFSLFEWWQTDIFLYLWRQYYYYVTNMELCRLGFTRWTDWSSPDRDSFPDSWLTEFIRIIYLDLLKPKISNIFYNWVGWREVLILWIQLLQFSFISGAVKIQIPCLAFIFCLEGLLS